MNNPSRKAWAGLLFIAAMLSLLLFVSAGTFRYWQAWVYLAVFFGPSAAITFYLSKHDPALLARRLKAGAAAEKERTQKCIMFIVQIVYTALYVVAGLDRRYGWSEVPPGVVIAADLLILVGLWINFLVYKENTFSAATIQVDKDQKVISTGPYALVRHPMYSGALLMFLVTPPALGSWWGLGAYVLLALTIVWRLLDEEKFLAKNLPGYIEYTRSVRYRLVPFVW